MPKPKKAGEWKQIGCRVPLATWRMLEEAARLRGVDVSAVVNWVLAETLPVLLEVNRVTSSAFFRHAAGRVVALNEKEE